MYVENDKEHKLNCQQCGEELPLNRAYFCSTACREQHEADEEQYGGGVEQLNYDEYQDTLRTDAIRQARAARVKQERAARV